MIHTSKNYFIEGILTTQSLHNFMTVSRHLFTILQVKKITNFDRKVCTIDTHTRKYFSLTKKENHPNCRFPCRRCSPNRLFLLFQSFCSN